MRSLNSGRGQVELTSRRFFIVTILAIGLAAAVAAVYMPYALSPRISNADIQGDWVLAKALASGDNPYEDMYVLSDRYAGGDYTPSPPHPSVEGPLRSPRLPGALVMSLPLSLIPYDLTRPVNAIVNIACVIVAYVLIAVRVRTPEFTFWALIALASLPQAWQVYYGNVAGIVALLLVATCLLSERSDSILGGVLLGICTTLKTYPLIMIGLFLARRQWRAIGAMATTLAIVNVTPLFLAFIPLSHAVNAIAYAGSRYAYLTANMSLPHQIEMLSGSAVLAQLTFAAIVGSALAWVFKRPTTTSLDGMFLLSLGVLMAPIAWPHYVVALFPFAAWVFHTPELPAPSRYLVVLSTLPAAIPTIPIVGVKLSVIALVMTAAAARRWQHSEPMTRPNSPVDPTSAA